MEKNEAVELLENLMSAIRTVTNKAEEQNTNEFAIKSYKELSDLQNEKIAKLTMYENHYLITGHLRNTEVCINCNSTGISYWSNKEGDYSMNCVICEGKGYINKE